MGTNLKDRRRANAHFERIEQNDMFRIAVGGVPAEVGGHGRNMRHPAGGAMDMDR